MDLFKIFIRLVYNGGGVDLPIALNNRAPYDYGTVIPDAPCVQLCIINLFYLPHVK